jgi:hypothetical protein
MTSTDPNTLELAGAPDMILASPAMSTIGRFTPGRPECAWRATWAGTLSTT